MLPDLRRDVADQVIGQLMPFCPQALDGTRRNRTRHQPRRFRVVHDRADLGLEYGRDRGALGGGKREGAENGRAYVELTVRNAALAVERRGRQPTRGTIAGNDRR